MKMLKHSGTLTIETERLILRPFRADDAEAVYRNWAADPEVTKYLMWKPHSSSKASLNWMHEHEAGYKNNDYYNWAITIKANGDEPIGSIGVNTYDEITEKAHIGYCISRDYWHMGITSEALKAVIDHLFDEVGMKRIESRHDPRNPNSGAVMKKCGMKYEGTLRRSDWNNQGICDAAYYSILSDER